MAKVWRQGDVIVRSLTEEEYEELKARSWPSNNPVITGENGHAHVIEADEVSETWDRARGIRVFVVMAVKAVAIRHEEHPDLVLCDLRMPEVDGLRVLEKLSIDYPETPIIIT